MYCKNCGKEIADNYYACPHCGAVVGQAQAETFSAPAYETVSNPAANTAQVEELASGTLKFGIMGLAFSELGIPGIILSRIGLKKADEFVRLNGSLTGRAKVGRSLAKAGSIVGIVMTVFWAIYAVVYTALIMMAL